jgi:small GTP-binding protein
MNFGQVKQKITEAFRDKAIRLDLDSAVTGEILSDENLSELLPDIRKLEYLTSLDLSNNRISDYSFLKELKSLTSLYLSNNQISDYSFLKELIFLTTLNLSNNQINDYSFLKELKSLTSLVLKNNQISDASFLKELKSLTSLDLSNNQISDYSFLKELKSLNMLYLSDNQINDYSFLKELKFLTLLYLSNNQISDASFLKELKSLTTLDLGYNQISDTSFLKELKSLTSLYLSNNQISDASFLKELKSLTSLIFSDNPNLDLPESLKEKYYLVRKDIDEIVRYYEQLEKEGEDYIYEAKVLIVGEPKAGKTTLFRKLQNPDYSPREATQAEKESTIGVDIEMLEFSFDEEKTFKAHLWDFGGQEKQYVLHQYFFTERSLYLLLADDRKELGNFNYWFEIIAALGKDCPVLVVLNEINAKVKNFDISVYKREFGEKILDIEEKSVNFANNADGRFANLANEIKTKLKNLEHIGKPLPKTWVKVRERLQEIKAPIIGIDDYETICEESGVEKPEYRRQILEYLHDLGIALNYRQDANLQNKLILKPNWVIDALYVVLKDEKINKSFGKFSSDDVFGLWKDYKADEKTILLQLMQKGKFEVAYKLEGKNEYIAPILLPEIAPEYDFDETDSLQIHFEYAFKPKGIISRLIVRFHENIALRADGEQIVWKKGVLLGYKNSLARIIESERSRKITITVSGASPVENRELITIIRTEIKRIHRDWFENRLSFEEKIPCYCEVCQAESEPQFYELETVESYYAINQEINCDKSVKAKRLQRVNPRRLLEGVYIEETRKDFRDFERNKFEIANLNITNIHGSENIVNQNVANSRITNQKKIVDEVSRKMNNSQNQTMQKLAGEIISRLEEELSKIGKESEELNEVKKGKWETKFKFALPFVPLEISRTVTPDEFISKVQKWLYGGDLQLNILEAEEEAKGLLNG